MEEFELEPGEHVIKTIRKHWFVFVVSLIPVVLLAWLPTLLPHAYTWLASVTLQGQAPAFDPATLPFNASLFRTFLGLWWLLLWIGAFNMFTQYYLNMWVITNMRIVEISQYGFFNRRVASFLLGRVQDVTTGVYGLFGTLIGYGTVKVETAGEDSNSFVMSAIENPEGMRDLIMREISELHKTLEKAGEGV
ncbi:MAG: hypothetical protein JWN64_81 [Parcubacteria group bacterium]|nr:hypothetical protein [Parcubacteria group bacterium]